MGRKSKPDKLKTRAFRISPVLCSMIDNVAAELGMKAGPLMALAIKLGLPTARMALAIKLGLPAAREEKLRALSKQITEARS